MTQVRRSRGNQPSYAQDGPGGSTPPAVDVSERQHVIADHGRPEAIASRPSGVATLDRVASVAKLWLGETAVILGGGSSLTPEDVAYCRGKARVLAIKEAYLLAPWADALYAGDAKWWRAFQGAQDFAGLKYTITQDPNEEQIGDWPDVQVLRNTGTDGLELEPTGLRTGYNSGYQSVGLAVHLGVSRIVLLGFDMWTGAKGQNWVEQYPHLIKSYHTPSPYPLFLQAFASIVEPLKKAGVDVVNSSRFTMLTAFPYLSLEEALT